MVAPGSAVATIDPVAPAQPVEHPEPTLTAHDRCDTRACGAKAYYRVDIDGSDLLFCYHHFHTFEEAIRKVATSITDESWVLFDEAANHSKGSDR